MFPCKLWSYYILYYYILSCNFLEDTQLCGTFPLLCCHVCTPLSGSVYSDFKAANRLLCCFLSSYASQGHLLPGGVLYVQVYV